MATGESETSPGKGNTVNRKLRGFVVKLLVSTVLLGGVLYAADFREVGDLIARANFWFLAGGIVAVHLDRVLMAYKWNLLLRVTGVSVPFRLLVQVCMVSPIAQVFLPSTIGGDAFRVYRLSKYGASTTSVLASIVMERLLGFLAIVLLVFFSFWAAIYYLGGEWQELAQLIWGTAGLVAAVAVFLLAIYLAFRVALPTLVKRSGNRKVVAQLERFHLLSKAYANNRLIVTRTFLWTFIEQLFAIGLVYLLAQSLHLEISLLGLLAIIPITVLALRLPISIDGLGVQEAVYVALFSLVGLSPAEALLLSTLKRGVQLASLLPWSVHYIYRGHLQRASTAGA